LFQRALGISQQHLGESHPDVAVTLNNLARLYFRQNEYASAGPLLQRLLSIKEQALGASHPEIAAILTSLAKVRLHQQDYDGGEAFARRALEIREKLKLPNDLAVATALETLAEINGARGRIDEEIRHRERALEVRTGAMGQDHALVIAARALLESRRAAATPPATSSATPPVAPPPSFTISPPPQRTTRTSSLPWIDPPEPPTFDRTSAPSMSRNSGSNGTISFPVHNGNGNGRENGSVTNVATPASPEMESPLAFHPLAESRPAPRTATPAASSAPQHVDAHATSAFTNSFARLVADTPANPTAVEYDAPAPTHQIEEPRTEISLDWPIEPRRPWLKILAAAAVLGVIAGGGWYFFSRYDAKNASAPRAVATTPVKSQAPLIAAKTDTLLVRHESPLAGPPASVVKPGVTSAIVPSAKTPVAAAAASAPSNDEGPPADAKHATHVSAKSGDPDPDLLAAPKMPTIKVDAITKMIDDSARRRADSVGNAIQQKAPTFKPKTYKPPE
jgi:hypothetical protein